MAPTKLTEGKLYDVFLSHSSKDTADVSQIALKLVASGIRPYFDKWHLKAGDPVQERLEEALSQSRTCAVFFKGAEIAPWRRVEMRTAIEQQVNSGLDQLIPIFLPDASVTEESLPSFIRRFKWIRFEKSLDDEMAYHELCCAIEGREPGYGPLDRRLEPNPFPGPLPFEKAQGEFFFGRDSVVRNIIDTLRVSRFVTVLGAPKTGKTSVLRAGLVPALEGNEVPGSSWWKILSFTPGFHPLDRLVDQVMHCLAPTSRPAERRRFRAALSNDQRALHVELERRLGDQAVIVCFLVDQLEELLIFDEADPERQAFLANLLYAAEVPLGHAVVVMTLCSDFEAEILRNDSALVHHLEDHRVEVPPMEESDLRQVLERSSEAAGLRFDSDLVEVILQDLEGLPEALSILQHTLCELWKRREGGRLTFEAYSSFGGPRGTYSAWADAIYAELSEPHKAIARRILLHMIPVATGPGEIRCNNLQNDLAEVEEIVYIAELFAGVHLFRVVRDPGDDKGRIIFLGHEGVQGHLHDWIYKIVPARLRWLRERAETWSIHERDPKRLLRGAELKEIEIWDQETPGEFDRLVRTFIEASQSARCTAEEEPSMHPAILPNVPGVGSQSAIFEDPDEAKETERALRDTADRYGRKRTSYADIFRFESEMLFLGSSKS